MCVKMTDKSNKFIKKKPVLMIFSSASFYEVSEFSPNVVSPFSFLSSVFVLKVNRDIESLIIL